MLSVTHCLLTVGHQSDFDVLVAPAIVITWQRTGSGAISGARLKHVEQQQVFRIINCSKKSKWLRQFESSDSPELCPKMGGLFLRLKGGGPRLVVGTRVAPWRPDRALVTVWCAEVLWGREVVEVSFVRARGSMIECRGHRIPCVRLGLILWFFLQLKVPSALRYLPGFSRTQVLCQWGQMLFKLGQGRNFPRGRGVLG